MAPSSYELFVGIDVAAETFTAFWTPFSLERERPITLPNTPDGSARLAQHLLATGVTPAATLIVLEVTSTYWIALAVALHTTGGTDRPLYLLKTFVCVRRKAVPSSPPFSCSGVSQNCLL
jgi:hypothetical protein